MTPLKTIVREEKEREFVYLFIPHMPTSVMIGYTEAKSLSCGGRAPVVGLYSLSPKIRTDRKLGSKSEPEVVTRHSAVGLSAPAWSLTLRHGHMLTYRVMFVLAPFLYLRGS